MDNIGIRIRQIRNLREMSQKEVALGISMNQGQYSRLESGKVEPTLSSLRKIANLFEISIADLLDEKNDIDKEINVPLLEKIKLIEQLDEKERESIMTIIDIAISKKHFKDNLSKLLAS